MSEKLKRIIPKLSASLLIVDNSQEIPRFLFGRRHEKHAFMPNRYVFPGGRVDGDDSRVVSPHMLNSHDQWLIQSNLKGRHAKLNAQTPALCALREAWEETGHLIGTPEAFYTPYLQWQAFVEHQLAPNLNPVRVLARAITPTDYSRRYDTWFFIVFRNAILKSIDVCGPNSELDHQIWASEAETHAFDLPSITRAILREALLRLEVDPDLLGNHGLPFYAARGGAMRRRLLNP